MLRKPFTRSVAAVSGERHGSRANRLIPATWTWHGTCGSRTLDESAATLGLRSTAGSAKLNRGMTTIRRHLRMWATAWLVVQAGWVSALVPRDCCAAHQPATAHAKGSCHESAADAHCPMPSADGTPCPMHRRQSEPGEHHHRSTKTNECALRGTCEGPMAALFALLSNPGILPESVAAIPNSGIARAPLPARENIVSRRDSPDPPPPRA